MLWKFGLGMRPDEVTSDDFTGTLKRHGVTIRPNLVGATLGGFNLRTANLEGRLREHLRDLIDPTIDAHHGRLVKTTGDRLLAEFGSVVSALAGCRDKAGTCYRQD